MVLSFKEKCLRELLHVSQGMYTYGAVPLELALSASVALIMRVVAGVGGSLDHLCEESFLQPEFL